MLRFLIVGLCLQVVQPAFGQRRADTSPATHIETKPIQFNIGKSGKIVTMAMDNRGQLLCGVSWNTGRDPIPYSNPRTRRKRGRRFQQPEAGQLKYAIKVVSQQGRVKSTWPMNDVTPKMLHGNADGTFYAGGGGKLGLFSSTGKLTKSIELKSIMNGDYADAHVSGMTANQQNLFIAFGHGFSLRATEDIVRFDRDLSNPKLIVETQFGCCSHIDLDTKDGKLLIAENSRHRVNQFSYAGKKLGSWGKRDRTNIQGFAACCNPVNFDFGPNGVLYTAESGIGRVKKYTSEGKYLGLVGYVDTTKFDRGSMLAAQSCYIPVEVSKDGRRVYVMDVRAQIIRVLKQKS